ncbi:hypothetical protein IFM89_007166 [Coptis chinensis]|uniref:Uncharacterized protein n=1 Tax=Coptis chinensis TaxID=261450 RepID=A0A835HFW3_9MAGN|nr:hypothetical protein IFM89_007166 [Coptis chinensis]
MASHHATLGRRTLEEIRQKRAAERLSKASSGPDLQSSSNPLPSLGINRSQSGGQLSESDISGLVSQIKILERRNMELEEENKTVISKLQAKEIENDVLHKRLNDLEQNSVPSLRKALRDVAMEKDAAVTAREDFSAQLRMVKKRLKEAEEEQYRTEEDAAALRAELNSLQQQAIMNPLGGISSMGISQDHFQSMEKELANLKSELQQVKLLQQQEQRILAEEQSRNSLLIVEKQELEERLAALSKKTSEAMDEAANKELSKRLAYANKFQMKPLADGKELYLLFEATMASEILHVGTSAIVPQDLDANPLEIVLRECSPLNAVREASIHDSYYSDVGFTQDQGTQPSGSHGEYGGYTTTGSSHSSKKRKRSEDKDRLEKQLHDMAVMVERLENSRQKLLMEIDSQSSEIERLFEENYNISASYEEATAVVVQWQNQVKDCLRQNEELRGLLDKLRTEKTSILPMGNAEVQSRFFEAEKDRGNVVGAKVYTDEYLLLEGQLAKEQGRAEELSAEVMKLSAQLQHAVQAYNGLARMYKPVFRNIESSLMKMKQDGSVTVQ